MKKHLILLLILAMVLGLAACRGNDPAPSTDAMTDPSTEATTEPTTVPTEPTTVPTTAPVAGTTVGGVDLTGRSLEEAKQALTEAAAAYKLTIQVNGKTFTVPAADLAVTLDEAALKAYLEALENGTELPASLFTYDASKLKSLLGDSLNVAPVNATVSYNSAKKQFVANDGKNGTRYDLDAAAEAAAAAIGLLEPNAEAQAKSTSIAPDITASSDKVKTAVNTANGYLKVSLSYTFSPEGGTKSTEKLSAATLAGFIKVSDEMKVSVSKSAIESYASTLSSRYNGSDYKGSFVTTGGSTIGTTVTYYGQRVNTAALADDIYKCITEQKSGEHTAPYKAKSSRPYGGSYIEIDLSSQKLYLYKDGERILSTSLVSGSVAEDCCTPTGVYSIYAKQTDRYLSGEGYRSYVNYWMPFLGGYGLHDATWRSSFGGTIYYYDGSHGCVNLPKSAAKTIYNNISVGTKVILYGGKREVPDLEQSLTGTTSYTVKVGDPAFKLDVKAKYNKATLTYTSSDTNVVTVSSKGNVTIKGPGTATITVKAEAYEFYTAAELKITITVLGTGETEPTTPTEPSKPTEPTEPSKPTEPSEPTQPSEPTEPTDPPTEPTTPPTEPPTEPTTPPTEPPTEPTTPPTEPPTEPTEPPTEATEPVAEEPAP